LTRLTRSIALLSFSHNSRHASLPLPVLIFETNVATPRGGGDFIGSVPYGNRVHAAIVGTHAYGPAHGFTPNVTASCNGTNAASSGRGAGYGSLTNVVWGAGSGNGLNEIRLTLEADPGFSIEFRGVDVARYSAGAYPGSHSKSINVKNNLLDLLANTQLGSTRSLDPNANPFVSTMFTRTFGQGW
jgi:hypothetical protein